MPPCFASAVNICIMPFSISFELFFYSSNLKRPSMDRALRKTHDTYMVKEPDTGADIDLLLSDARDMVEINRARDMRLAGRPFHRGNTFRHGVMFVQNESWSVSEKE